MNIRIKATIHLKKSTKQTSEIPILLHIIIHTRPYVIARYGTVLGFSTNSSSCAFCKVGISPSPSNSESRISLTYISVFQKVTQSNGKEINSRKQYKKYCKGKMFSEIIMIQN